MGQITRFSDFLILIAVIIILTVLIVPLPPFLLDFFITISFASALLIFFVSIYTQRPLDISTFPTILLTVTLFRLSLSIATTRAILLHGAQSADAAGKFIKTFGYFVVGGSYIVGFIIFIILVIINFVVITKGAGRVAEVAARFTLDAMPGKQMSIDADLNSGILTEVEAKKRRQEITKEADFYGAMDGASKFVRGDAIAGLLITFINIIGGIIIGVLQHNMNLSEAASRYTVLTIGDGLVVQLPALIISTAAGIVITKSSSEESLAPDLINQLTKQYKALYLSAAILGILALIPGMPHISLIFLALIFAYLAYSISQKKIQEKLEEEKNIQEQAKAPIVEENIEEAMKINVLELEIGYGLIHLTEEAEGGNLLNRIKLMRKQLALDIGVIISSIRIRDNLTLDKNEYIFLIKGIEVGRYKIEPDRLLAMSPAPLKQIEGISTKEPAFGLQAIWIEKEKKNEAIVAGYTVVDPVTVIITHITELIKRNIYDIFTRQDANKLLENLKGDYPKVIEELGQYLSLGQVHRILKNLLKEQVPIRDLLTIFETLADWAPHTKDLDLLTEHVRSALAYHITNKYKNENNVLNVILLGSSVEGVLTANIKEENGYSYMNLPPNIGDKLMQSTQNQIARAAENGIEPIIVTSPRVRRHFKAFLDKFFPRIIVLSYSEIANNVEIKTIDTIEL
ncbi:Flagellar biosynthesis protein FlhA [Desulfurella amilsii]|uniref:Flagellar biosynthesis protein FlhA n=2 Tax=Desulfurella amilsii TaxID=1562698 RepID=A0A1X4XYZ4_9BACT|nr:Flagellar biosynthesis protein FlhA [Desulfurella amilsii]OSS42837.1 Flagellar biosynthesis protein FlhA [Desulfurella amilsii]